MVQKIKSQIGGDELICCDVLHQLNCVMILCSALDYQGQFTEPWTRQVSNMAEHVKSVYNFYFPV